MSLKNKKFFLLDMDGTIYLDNNLFDGTLDFLNYVKKNGGRYIFLTNNSSKSADAYLEKLENMTVHCAVEKLELVIGETDSEVVEVWKEGTSSKKTSLTCSVNNNVVKCSLEKEGYAKITAQSVGTAKVTFSLVDDSTGKTIDSTVVDVTVTEKTKTYTA